MKLRKEIEWTETGITLAALAEVKPLADGKMGMNPERGARIRSAMEWKAAA